jgi:hypothetical protein
LNILYKFSNKININYRKCDNNIPSLYIYNFSDLKEKKFEIDLTPKQKKMAEEIINDKDKLLSILGERYAAYANRSIKRVNTNFIISAEILEYLNTLNKDQIFDEYKTLPIIDYNSYDYETEEQEDNNDITSNIIKYASYLYRDDITVKEYSKLVKYYLLGLKDRIGSRILNFAYQMIYMMSEKIDKTEIENNLIRELSKSQIEIEIGEINKYKRPENRELKINIIEILNYYYDKITYETMITYLSQLYKYDENNKFQNKIQDLLFKRGIYGGENTIETDVPLKHKSTEDAVNVLLSDDIIKGLEKTINNIRNLLSKATEAEISESILQMKSIYEFVPDGINNSDGKFETFEDYNDMSIFNRKHTVIKTNAINNEKILEKLKSKKAELLKIKRDIIKELNKYLETPISLDEGTVNQTKTTEQGYYIKEFNSLISPIDNLLVRIESTSELQKYPLLERIYSDYKSNEKSLHPKKTIDDFINLSKNVLNKNLEKIQLIIERYNLMISSFESTITSKTGGKLLSKTIKGGENKDEINKINDLKTNNKLNDLLVNLKKIKGNRDIKKNVEKTMATPNFIDSEGLNVFDRLLESYDKDYENKDIPHEITNNKFYNRVKNLNLDPEEELAITLNDKIIFALVIYIIRVIALNICYFFIDKNKDYLVYVFG